MAKRNRSRGTVLDTLRESILENTTPRSTKEPEAPAIEPAPKKARVREEPPKAKVAIAPKPVAKKTSKKTSATNRAPKKKRKAATSTSSQGFARTSRGYKSAKGVDRKRRSLFLSDKEYEAFMDLVPPGLSVSQFIVWSYGLDGKEAGLVQSTSARSPYEIIRARDDAKEEK